MSAWKTASLGEIFDIARGGSPRPIQDYITDDVDGVNWISISDASASDKFITETKKRIRPEGVSRSRMVNPGDFLLTNSMSFGRPYIMGTSGCIHDGWLVLSSKHGDVDQDYFFHLLGSDFIYAKFTKLAAGATVKNLNIDLVSGVEVNFPPLEEQRRIAAILDQAETLRTQRRQALAHLDTLTQSLFLDMFGDPQSNPKGWKTKALTKFFQFRTGKLDSNAATQDGAYPFFTCSREDFRIDTYAFDCEALLLAGNNANAAYSVKHYRGKFNAYQRTYVLTLADVANSYIYARVVLEMKLQELKRESKGSSTKYLTLGLMDRLTLPVPDPDLQQTFASRIQAIEALKATHRTALAQLDALFASLQQRAFAGAL